MAEMKFEEALQRLETIVNDLEGGDLPLEDAMVRYEEGVRLSKLCAKKLEDAKKKVEILVKTADGSVELQPFDEHAAPAEPKPKAAKKKRPAGEELF